MGRVDLRADVIGDARTQTFGTQPTATGRPRPRLIGLLNGPIQWGDSMWAALTWDTIAAQKLPHRNMLLHESFHIVQMRLGLGLGTDSAEHLDERNCDICRISFESHGPLMIR